MDAGLDDPWDDVTPRQLQDLLSEVQCLWWIAGGWAIDLYLPERGRAHADIDVGCFRTDTSAFMTALPHWEFFTAVDGVLGRIEPGGVVPAPVYTLWCRAGGSRSWGFELMIEEQEGLHWSFRRDPAVRREKESLLWYGARGLAVLRPEVQLLYKAKDVRARDQSDFDVVVRSLDPAATEWLVESMERVHPGHAWTAVLKDVGGHRP